MRISTHYFFDMKRNPTSMKFPMLSYIIVVRILICGVRMFFYKHQPRQQIGWMRIGYKKSVFIMAYTKQFIF